VVPNVATDRLIAAGGFTQAHAPGAGSPLPGSPPLHVVVKFTQGVHASFLDPTASLAVTEEMQLEAISFTGAALPAPANIPANTPGSFLLIANPAVVQ
jgi:hypothetical protein